MMVSIDGKIEGYFADAPLTGACGDYYEEVIPKLGDAHGTGSYTACLYMAQADVDYDAFKDTPVEDGDFIVKNEEGKYLFVFDRHGKCILRRNADRGSFDPHRQKRISGLP